MRTPALITCSFTNKATHLFAHEKGLKGVKVKVKSFLFELVLHSGPGKKKLSEIVKYQDELKCIEVDTEQRHRDRFIIKIVRCGSEQKA